MLTEEAPELFQSPVATTLFDGSVIVLFVNVLVVASPTKVSDSLGNEMTAFAV
jgi:hypothetical protein